MNQILKVGVIGLLTISPFISGKAQISKLKDKISEMKGPTSVEGILGMTPEDVQKMRADSASDVLDKKYQEIKGLPDPLGVNGVYYLKYPMKLKNVKGAFFVKKVLIEYNDEKKLIFVRTSYSENENAEALQIDAGGGAKGVRVNKKMGSLYFTGEVRGYYTDYSVIGPKFIYTHKKVYEKQELVKINAVIEIDKGIFYLVPNIGFNVCNPKTKDEEDAVASLKSQKGLFYNLMTKKENVQRMDEFDFIKIIDKHCENRKKYTDLLAVEPDGYSLPVPPANNNTPIIKRFGENVIANLENQLKDKGYTHFKPLYAYSMNGDVAYGYHTEKRPNPVSGVMQNVHIGRFVQFIVVCENLNVNSTTKNDYSGKEKYCYFTVNMVEYVKDRTVHRLERSTVDSDYTAKYELLAASPAFFCNPEENSTIMRYKK